MKTALEKLGVKDADTKDEATILAEVQATFKTRLINSEDEFFKTLNKEIHNGAYARNQNESKAKIAKAFGFDKSEYDDKVTYDELLQRGIERKDRLAKEASAAAGVTPKEISDAIAKAEQEKLALLREFDEHKKNHVPIAEIEKIKSEVNKFKKISKIADATKKITNIVGNFNKIQYPFLEGLEAKYDVTVSEDSNELQIRKKDGKLVLDKDQRNELSVDDIIRNELDVEWQLLAKAQPQPESKPTDITPSNLNNNTTLLEQWRTQYKPAKK